MNLYKKNINGVKCFGSIWEMKNRSKQKVVILECNISINFYHMSSLF